MGCGYLQLICGWAVDRVLFYVGKSYFILDRVIYIHLSELKVINAIIRTIQNIECEYLEVSMNKHYFCIMGIISF